MKPIFHWLAALPLLALLSTDLRADPQLTSWFTTNSGKYARIYQSTANETAGTTSATWTRGQGTQSNPVYADVSEINHSANWVYIRTSNLASHVMGPWFLDAAKTTNFPNFPANQSAVYRIPRTPTIPTTKTLTGAGVTGRMVNGISIFDSRDTFSYSNTAGKDQDPTTTGVTGGGIWNRDGYTNEGVTFDPALAHQAGSNYHYHAHPIALRYQLGDHIDYNATTNRYTESTAAVTAHSPIVGWASDGLPVYGPYGYSNPTSASSGIRRMISGFSLRNGTNGTTAITVRQVLPLWAQRIQNKPTLTTTQYGPAVNATFFLGRYIEDNDYRGDLAGQVQTTGATVRDFDLNEQNVRFCVTPEFPAGTWAYFTTINADGTPQYPYTTGRQYYGSPTGGSTTVAVMNANTPLTQQFLGGPSKALTVPTTPTVSDSTVTITWSAVEGGTYSVEASPTTATWTSKGTGIVSTGISKSASYTAIGSSGTEYGRVKRTALATYDANGFATATVAQTSAAVPYTLTLISTNANLSTLVPGAGSLTPTFSSGANSYTMTVANTVSTITFTPAVQDSAATVKVNGTAVSSGTASGAIPLLVGGNVIEIVVTPQSGTPTYTYTVNVTRQSAIETWRETWYGSSDNSGNATNLTDPYNTGLSNLLVFAFFGPAQNPASANPSLLPQPVKSSENFSYNFTQPSGVSGITYGAEWSATLTDDWSPVSDTGSGDQHIFSVPVSTFDEIFMRLKVTSP